jgi:hypothetical protein
MSVVELLQILAVVLVILGIVAGVVMLSRKEGAAYAAVASRYGLAFSKEKQGTGLGNVRQSSVLQGEVEGVPVKLVATYETRGRTRMRGTWIATDNPMRVPPCAINVSGTAPKTDVHLVRTGDAAFDARRWITSDTPTAVRFLLGDEVRARLLACPQAESKIVVDGGTLVFSFGGTPSSLAELQAPLDALLALAKAARR